MTDAPPPDEAPIASEDSEAWCSRWATQVDWKRIGKSKVFWVAVAAVATISILFWTTNNAVFIDPFIIPPSLARTGLSSEGLAAQVGDVLSKLETATRASYLRRDLVSPGDDTMAPDVVIPGTGVSVKAIAGVLRSLFATHVTGVLVLARADGTSPNATITIFITRRAHPASAAQFSQRVENIDALSVTEIDSLVKRTAKEILHHLNPLLFAACLVTNGELDSAIQVAGQQAAIQTGNGHMMAAAYDVWGDALQKHEFYDDALAMYKKAEALDPQYSATHNNLGAVYASKAVTDTPNMQPSVSERRTLFKEAAAEYRLAIEQDPKNAAAYRNQGVAYRNQHDVQNAIAAFTQAVELAPEDPDLYDDLADTLRISTLAGREESAKENTDKANALRLAQPQTDIVTVCTLDSPPASSTQ